MLNALTWFNAGTKEDWKGTKMELWSVRVIWVKYFCELAFIWVLSGRLKTLSYSCPPLLIQFWPHFRSWILSTSSLTRFARSTSAPSFANMRQSSAMQCSCAEVSHAQIASASATAPPMASRLIQWLFPECVRLSCCSPITSASATALQLHPLLEWNVSAPA